MEGQPIIYGVDKKGRVSSTRTLKIFLVQNDGEAGFKTIGGGMRAGGAARLVGFDMRSILE